MVALLLAFLWDSFPFSIFWKFYWVTKHLHLFHLFIHVHMCLVCVCLTYIRYSGKFWGVQFSWKGNLQRFRGLIFADGRFRTATFLQNELLSIKAQSLQPLYSQKCVFLPEIRRKLLTVASFRRSELSSVSIIRFTSALADSMDDGPVVDRGPLESGSLVVSLDVLK